MTDAVPARLTGVHHTAFRCRDAEQTRWFYEDVLGLPLAAALAFEEEPGTGRKRPYMHLFFALPDSNYIAFFDDPGDARPEHFEMAHGFDRHIAIEAASEAEMLAYKARIRAAGVPCFGPIDHHFVRSIYMYDPNGLQVEITSRAPDHDRIMAHEAQGAREAIRRWADATRAEKVAKFGADALDRRAPSS